MLYKYGTVGGTFDRLHRGHRKMLKTAFDKCEKVYIGIVTEAFAVSSKHESKLPDLIQSYNERFAELTSFLKGKGLLERSEVVQLQDRFGSTLKEENLQAIVVSPETELVATEINLLRAQKSWPALEVITVPWVLADDGSPISSKRIRLGEIDREGRLYGLPSGWKVRFLPIELRDELKRPLGELFVDSTKNHEEGIQKLIKSKLISQNHPFLISVGDAVTHALINESVIPDISIIDFKIARKPVFKSVADIGLRNIKVIKKAINQAGTINIDAANKLLSLIRSEAKPAVLQINGEDDLMTLLAIYFSPLNSLIVYGQPQEGIVLITVTEDLKQRSRDVLSKFKKQIV